ncbi:TPR-like protein [Auricularia subglabra TFB-10046 SS5]|nr:TPR-like protein [Auricularia subglabra TFB-10046 SS5]
MASAATTLKDEGNALLAQGKYLEAQAKYTEAIKVSSGKDTAVLYCNRAQANLLLKKWDEARYDAADALVADPNFHKAWLRLGRAYDGIKDFAAARRAYSIGMSLSKDNAPLMRAFDEASREPRAAFQNAPHALPPCEPPSDPTRTALSLRLKDEGNALFANRSNDPDAWYGAYMKFTLGLAFDRSSAVLYCNRAYLCVLQEW